MKKIICLSLILLLLLAGCRKSSSDISSNVADTVVSETESKEEQTVSSFTEVSSAQTVTSSVAAPPVVSTPSIATPPLKQEVQEIKNGNLGINGGIWLSFLEINDFLSSKKGFKTEFKKVINDMKSLGITDLYFHIRSHCDSVVKSDFFPQTEKSAGVNFDILQYAIDLCHKEGIRIHGWINPYRVTASHSDVAKLPQNSPAVKWLNESKTQNVVVMNGIYLNPAELEARKLIVDGVRELINKYSLDGIHFDDYFYPTTDPKFDELSYTTYKNGKKNPLSLEEWRRANVDLLISDTKTAINFSGKKLIFSVSPAANITKNYNDSYADVKGWAEKGYIDEVIPQIYFGFKHTDPKFNFDSLLKEWTDLVANSKVTLRIGLAPYKIGTESKTDGTEWMENTDILSRQVKLCRENTRVSGVVFYSYSTLFSDKENNKAERENLLQTS